MGVASGKAEEERQDAAARVTSAAIGVADAKSHGLDDSDVLAAVRTAARGRADRAEALQTIVERQRLHDGSTA